MTDLKLCPTCKSQKLIGEFWKGQTSCIPCTKEKQKNRWQSRTPKKRLEQHLKYRYGISPEQFFEALEQQKHKCAICDTQLPNLLTYENRRRGYAIDHNHETGEFRGVLCLHCNSLLGMAQDNTKILLSAISYLEQKGSYAKAVFANG